MGQKATLKLQEGLEGERDIWQRNKVKNSLERENGYRGRATGTPGAW